MRQEFSFIVLFARGNHFYPSLSMINRNYAMHYFLNNVSNVILPFKTKSPNFSPLSGSTTKSLGLSPVLRYFSENFHRIFNIFSACYVFRVTHIFFHLYYIYELSCSSPFSKDQVGCSHHVIQESCTDIYCVRCTG
jgi:hypothetical protein